MNDEEEEEEEGGHGGLFSVWSARPRGGVNVVGPAVMEGEGEDEGIHSIDSHGNTFDILISPQNGSMMECLDLRDGWMDGCWRRPISILMDGGDSHPFCCVPMSLGSEQAKPTQFRGFPASWAAR